MFAVLEPLLADDGYAAQPLESRPDQGYDFIAERAPSAHHEGQRLLIELKYRLNSQPLTLDAFSRFLVVAMQ